MGHIDIPFIRYANPNGIDSSTDEPRAKHESVRRCHESACADSLVEACRYEQHRNDALTDPRSDAPPINVATNGGSISLWSCLVAIATPGGPDGRPSVAPTAAWPCG